MLKQQEIPAVLNTQAAEAKTVLELARKSHEKYLIKLQREDLDEAINYYVSAIKIDPNMSETYYRLASLLWENGQITLTAAIEQCKSAISLSPDNPNARIYTAYFLNIAQQYEEAEKEFKEAIKINPIKSARSRLSLAMMLFNKMKTKRPNFVEFTKSFYYLFSGGMTLALDYPSLKMLYKNLIEVCAVRSYETFGNAFEKMNNHSMAIKTFDIGAEKTGRNELFYEKIGDISIQQDAPEIALDSYKKALEANPNNRDILVKVATVLQTYFEESINEAVDCYNRALELEGQNEKIYYELGHLYLKKDESLNAANAFKLAIELDDLNPFYHNSLAYALVQAEQYEEAIEHYQIAINLNPDNEWTSIVCQALGTLHYKIRNNTEAAIALYHTALVLNPKCDEAYVCLGDIYFDNEDIEMAIKCYCDAITINPENPKSYSKCGMALWESEYLEEAIVAYNKAISLDSNYDIAYNNLGVIYLDGIGNTKEAVSLFEEAIEINPNYTLAYFNLARAQQVLGDNVSAAQNYQMAVNLNKLTNDIDENDIQDRLFKLFEV